MIQGENKKGRLLKALIEIGQELVSTTDLGSLLGKILDVSRDVFSFENAIIRLLEGNQGVLFTAASYGYDEQATRRVIPVGHGIMGKVAETGRPILIQDLMDYPGYVVGIRHARSELAVPLIVRNRVIGVFNVESIKPNRFSEEDLSALEILGRQAASAIENADLYQNLRTVSTRYQKLHQFNSRILKSVDLGIYTVDESLRITSWNPAMEKMSGVTEDEAIGRDLLTLFPQLVQEGIAHRIRQVLSCGEAEKVKLAHRDYRGEIRFQRRRIAPLKDETGTTGAVIIVEDTTDFKRLLDQTIQSEKLAELGRLSAGIAHEINNPLSTVSYAAQLLMREDDLPPFQLELLERIESEVDRLTTLTGGLLSFSRARETLKRFTDLNDVVRDVLRLVRYELMRRNIDIIDNFAELPLIQADANKIKQVMINLIMNAAQAMKKDGKLSLGTRRCGTDTVEILVADDGPGIAVEMQEKIFEPFFSSKDEKEGTGLGLYICRIIIADHNGELLLESEPGQGARFRILLPVGDSA